MYVDPLCGYFHHRYSSLKECMNRLLSKHGMELFRFSAFLWYICTDNLKNSLTSSSLGAFYLARFRK